MKTDQIIMCVVALFLGMLLANMLTNVCGCNIVEGQTGTGLTRGWKTGVGPCDHYGDDEDAKTKCLDDIKQYGQELTAAERALRVGHERAADRKSQENQAAIERKDRERAAKAAKAAEAAAAVEKAAEEERERLACLAAADEAAEVARAACSPPAPRQRGQGRRGARHEVNPWKRNKRPPR